MLAAIHGISVFLAVIGCIVLVGCAIERILKDVQKSRRSRNQRRR